MGRVSPSHNKHYDRTITYKPNNVCNASTANETGSRSAPRISAGYAQESTYFVFIRSIGILQEGKQIFTDCSDPTEPWAHSSLVSYKSTLTYSALAYSALSPCGAKNNDTQILCLFYTVL